MSKQSGPSLGFTDAELEHQIELAKIYAADGAFQTAAEILRKVAEVYEARALTRVQMMERQAGGAR